MIDEKLLDAMIDICKKPDANKPIEPIKPANKPIEPIKAGETANKPAEPIKPTTKPIEPIKPAEPTNTGKPAESTEKNTETAIKDIENTIAATEKDLLKKNERPHADILIEPMKKYDDLFKLLN